MWDLRSECHQDKEYSAIHRLLTGYIGILLLRLRATRLTTNPTAAEAATHDREDDDEKQTHYNGHGKPQEVLSNLQKGCRPVYWKGNTRGVDMYYWKGNKKGCQHV